MDSRSNKQFFTLIQQAQHISLALFNRISKRKLSNNSSIFRNHLWQEFCNSEVIIAGLDDSFTTLYGPFPILSNLYSVFLGKLLRKKVVLYASSIGPFNSVVYKKLGKYIVDMADLVTLREDLSFNYLKKIGVRNKNVYVTSDLAFALKPIPTESTQKIMAEESIDSKPLIGVSLSQVISHWAFPNEKDPDKKYRNFVHVISKVLDNLSEKIGGTVVFIPQSFGPDRLNDDRIVHRDIFNSLKNKDKAKLLERELSPEELRGISGQLDLFISARTHAIISAAIMHTPFLAFSYASFKTHGIIGRMIQCEDLVYDITNLDTHMLLDKLLQTWNNRTNIRQELEFKVAPIKEKASLNSQLIEKFFR